MKYRVVLHPFVVEDIRRNAVWWAEHHSSEEAVEWFDYAFASLESLEEFPASQPLAMENEDFPYELRNLLFGFGSRPSYRALFTVRDDVVHVLTVQYGAQNVVRPPDIDFEA
jgi:hypothetical protein